jgi:hypothetical protein
MRTPLRLVYPVSTALLWCVLGGFAQTGSKRPDPAIKSIHPFTLQRGASATAVIRGTGLKGVRNAVIAGQGIRIAIEGIAPEPQPGRTPSDEVRIHVDVDASVEPGRYPLRLVSTDGVSNALPLHVTDLPVASEPEGVHDSASAAVPVTSKPVVFTGRLSRRGEADYYAFQAKAGEVLTFEVISGLPQIAAGGSAATIPNFDPSLTILEAGASWFDPQRLNRIAYNDEPVFVFGRITDAHLTHRFARTGAYWLRVEAFAGQGGPDYSYHLKIVPGERPQDLPPAEEGWQERSFTRKLSQERLSALAVRGGAKDPGKPVENYRAAPVPAAEAPKFQLPGTLRGVIAKPGETHRARFAVDGPKDIAIEVETPSSAPPFFNPLVRLLNAEGGEVATNVLAGKGACSGAMTKSLQSKVIIPLREAGEYTMEVRELTADHAGPDFEYRVQVRPQLAHVGDIRMLVDHLNLAPEEAKTVKITFDREEDFRGGVAITAENLPAGVFAHTGSDFEEDRDPPEPIGKRERFLPRQERTTLVFAAAPDAPPTPQPHEIRLVVRPLANGRLGQVIATKSIPLMVVSKE